MTDLLTRLRQLSRAEHDDLDVVDEAVEEIVNLRTDVHVLQEILGRYKHDSALQSQDREDAERYRRLRDGQIDDIAVVRGLGATDYGASVVIGTYEEEIDGDDLDEAIDHARRCNLK